MALPDEERLGSGEKLWGKGCRLLFIVNESYFFYSHRLPVARAALEAGFEVHVAGPDDHVWAPDSFGTDILAGEGFVYHTIPLNRRGINPFQDAKTIWALWKLHRRLRPSLVHHLTIKPVLYGGIVARLFKGCGVLNAITGLGHIFSATSLKSIVLRRIIVQLYRLSLAGKNSLVVVQNQDDGEQLVRIGAVSEDKINLIRGSGVSMSEYSPSAEVEGLPLVILPARLIWAKGVGEFVSAARQLRQEGIPARFALLGGANSSYPGAVSELQLRQWVEEGCIEWWGYQENMRDVYRDCHIVCLPTSYGEGVPRVLIEAAACGRPVVTTNVAGCRDIVENGMNGLLVPPGDHKSLVDALRRLLTDRELRQELGLAGRGHVERGFSETAIVEQTLDIYRQLLPLSASANKSEK